MTTFKVKSDETGQLHKIGVDHTSLSITLRNPSAEHADAVANFLNQNVADIQITTGSITIDSPKMHTIHGQTISLLTPETP